ncbi:MAG: integrase, partial [Gammaproteobacteria bacterium]
RNYDARRRVYEAQTRKAGLSKMHGLRHEYAQRRYAELTGWEAPVRGGPSSRDLNEEQKRIDREARLIISHELGHERIQVTAIYCGA